MNKKRNILFVLLFVLFVNLSSAAIVQTAQGADTLFIEYQKFDYFKTGEPFELNVHVYNQTGFPMTNETVNCSFHAYNANGTHALDLDLLYDSDDIDFYYTIPGEAFIGGKASWIIQCNNHANGGFASGMAKINNAGYELTLTEILVYFIFLFVMIMMMHLINNQKSKTDFNKKKNDIIKNYDSKHKSKTFIDGMMYNVFKNTFLWNYLLGWGIISILKQLLERFAINDIHTWFTVLSNLYSIGFVFVVGFVIYFTVDFFRDTFEKISQDNWGLGNG